MNDILQINVYEFDERFYQMGEKYAPSVTYKLSCASPTEYGLIQWRGDVGNKRADEILEESSQLGSYVHDAIFRMIQGQAVKSEEVRAMFSKGSCLKVLKCLKGFEEWFKSVKPEVLGAEFTTWNDKYNFAGTVDLKCKINGEVWIVDYKTSKSIHDDHQLQLSAYGYSEKVGKLGILHLGNTTKQGWSFLEIKDPKKYWQQFEKVSELFDLKYPNAKPNQDIFPIEFNLFT